MSKINLEDNRIVYFDQATGNYKIWDGERWWLDGDSFGERKNYNYAVVGTAIVGTDIVGG